MLDIANRIKKMEPSATLAMSAKARELKAAGKDIIPLAAGEPDCEPPYEAREAAINAIRDGNAHYTDNAGIPELRQKVSEKLTTESKITSTTDQVLITAGAKSGLFLTLQALVNEGDEVIVFAPYWVSYIEQIRMAGGVPKIITLSEDDGFKLDPEELERLITARVKGLILNSPSNPTGAVYNTEELKLIGDIALKKGIFVISDEIYEYFNYNGSHISLASLSPKYENVITINGFSKAYAMPGWRAGYVHARADIIRKLDEMQSHSASHVNNIAQLAALTALKESQKFPVKMAAEYKERRDFLVGALNSMHGLRCQMPEGAFYAFPNIQYYLAKDVGGQVPTNSLEFSKILLEKAQISVVPGSAFGAEGYVRISFTQPLPRLQEAVKRLKTILDK